MNDERGQMNLSIYAYVDTLIALSICQYNSDQLNQTVSSFRLTRMQHGKAQK